MSAGRKTVRFVEKALTRGIRASRQALRSFVDALDEAPKAFDRLGDEIESVIENADRATDVVEAKDANEEEEQISV